MTDSEILGRLEARFGRFETFVNSDVSNLLGALAALVARYSEDGFTEAEKASETSQVAVRWALERGKQQVSQLMAVSLWSALEAYVEDLWIEAALRVEIEERSPLRKVRASILEVEELPEVERYRKLWEMVDAPKAHGAARFDKVYAMIGVNISLKTIKARGHVVPDVRGTPVTDPWTRQTLHELQCVRNVIVHRGGVVDERLSGVTDRRLNVGADLEIEDSAVLDYGTAVITYAACALSAVADRLELPITYEDGE